MAKKKFSILKLLPGKEAMKRLGVPKPLRRLLPFWMLSVTGWCIDLGLLTLFTHVFGVPVFLAVCMAMLPALAWMFTFSTYRIFFKDEGFSKRKFALYVAYNFCMMLVFAYLINRAAQAGYPPVATKVFFSPVTFSLNYAFMKYLLKR